jgi:hypothetical protein
MGGRFMGRSGKGGAVLSVIDSPVTNHGVSNAQDEQRAYQFSNKLCA